MEAWKKKIKELGIILLFIFGGIVSFVLGIAIQVFPHEYGHYFFAYLGNKDAILTIEFYHLEILKDLLQGTISEDYLALGKVQYTGTIPEVFKGIWTDLVYLGGLIFSLAFIVLLTLIIKGINKSEKPVLKVINTGILLPFFVGVIGITVLGWWRDGSGWIMYRSLGNFGVGIITITTMVIFGLGIWFYFRN